MMPRVLAPTEASPDGDAARQLAHAIGTALGASDGTAAAADLLALGGLLADARQSIRDLADEAFVDTAYDLLDELERAYGLPVQPELGVAARRARLLAKVRAARAGSPDAIALSVGALDPGYGTVSENTPATVPRDADDGARAGGERMVFHFGVRLSVAVWNDAAVRERLRRLVAQMKPAHTTFDLHTNDPADGFRFNDPDSLFGRDAFFAV